MIMVAPSIKIGTRGSPLALWQANEVASRLRAALNLPKDGVELVIIRTSGDMSQAGGQALVGGKGAFTKEIDEAMLAGEIDFAVHSAKDMPTRFPDGIDIIGYLPREDVRDCLISARYSSIEALPQGAVIGTASLRRAALMKRLRPDVKTQVLRGNVDTRIRKSAEGEVDATLLALAGLKRLGISDKAAAILPLESFPPAIGQGAVGVTARSGDARAASAFTLIADLNTGFALAAERAFLTLLDGSCRTPIAGHATIDSNRLNFHGLYLSHDGQQSFTASGTGLVTEAVAIGEAAARDILAVLPSDIRSENA
jgi:hydroxymethylbilane synthase